MDSRIGIVICALEGKGRRFSHEGYKARREKQHGNAFPSVSIGVHQWLNIVFLIFVVFEWFVVNPFLPQKPCGEAVRPRERVRLRVRLSGKNPWDGAANRWWFGAACHTIVTWKPLKRHMKAV